MPGLDYTAAVSVEEQQCPLYGIGDARVPQPTGTVALVFVLRDEHSPRCIAVHFVLPSCDNVRG
jgi:hypothetical protein